MIVVGAKQMDATSDVFGMTLRKDLEGPRLPGLRVTGAVHARSVSPLQLPLHDRFSLALVLFKMSAPAARRQTISNLMRSVSANTSCHCHAPVQPLSRSLATPQSADAQPDYAFELAASNLRFGPGVTREVGMDFNNLAAKKVALFTDPNIAQLLPMQAATEALDTQNVNYVVYDKCRVEPNSESWEDAVQWARSQQCDAFLAVGGGCVSPALSAHGLYHF